MARLVRAIKVRISAFSQQRHSKTRCLELFEQYLPHIRALQAEKERLGNQIQSLKRSFDRDWELYEASLKKYCMKKDDIDDFVQITNQFGTTVWINMKGNGYTQTTEGPQDVFFQTNRANLHGIAYKEMLGKVQILQDSLSKTTLAIDALQEKLKIALS
jgi:hypothetical protein